MLKKIPVDQVRLGMHLHALEGPWLEHPFWKSKFVIRDQDMLKKLQASSVREVWIDVAKGLDVATPDSGADLPSPQRASLPAQPRGPEPAPPLPAPPSPAPPLAPPPARSTMQDELSQAARICHDAKAQVESMFGEARMGKALDAEACAPLVEEISRSVFRNPGALVSLARLKTQDDYTYMHSVAVCALMVALARESGEDEASCRSAGFAGLLHDMGKAMMPLEVLNKPGKLTDAEFDIMRTHPLRGHELLMEARGADALAMDVCLHHHEKMDGSGYPHKLGADAISRHARMGAICDVYDAVTSNRPYKAGWDPAESIARMASW